MNNKQLNALIRAENEAMKSIGDGLYFRIAREKPEACLASLSFRL